MNKTIVQERKILAIKKYLLYFREEATKIARKATECASHYNDRRTLSRSRKCWGSHDGHFRGNQTFNWRIRKYEESPID